jgi:hypothetical protein
MRERIVSVASRAKRILSPITSFRANSGDSLLPTYVQTKLCKDETLVGVYFNHSSSSVESVAVTEKGICFEDKGNWVKVDYSEINSIVLPSPVGLERSDALIGILKNDGIKISIPIRGGQDRFFDLYEFGRFLMRVSDDFKRGM